MPEVLNDYLQNRDITTARQIQNEILEAYERDFSKYADKNQAIKTSQIWKSIPYQLAKENKKFKYSDVDKNSRAATYEQSIEWLHKAGLVHIINQISVPKLPLSGYTDNSKFKIYMHDTGLLGAMLNLSSSIIIEPTELFVEYNGAFTENYVATQLLSGLFEDLHYWTSKSDAEVDFIFEKNNEIYPIEVKSGLSRNKKSLESYSLKYNPQYMFRLSPRNFIIQGNFINIPLYSIDSILRFF
jgi:predicted AAA+ superfamily ATPase